MYAHVLVNTPVKHHFTYLVPEKMDAAVGLRCVVELGKREKTAYITELFEQVDDTTYEFKPIKRLIDREPVFGSNEVELAQWMSRFYLCSTGEALSSMIPGGRREIGIPPFDTVIDEPLVETDRLTESQTTAIYEILSESHAMHYVYGVTGSGKSEVFLRVAEAIIEKGRQVIYLVPEITLTHQLARMVSNRFKNRVAILHSQLTPSQRLAEWKKIKRGDVDLAIGARSAVFAPFERLGLIIIDEEHENSYKAGNTPRYHARQVAQKRASDQQALLVMGSATPSLEAWHMMKDDKIARHDLSFRVAGGKPPAIEVVNMLQEQRIVSRKLIRKIEEVIERKRQVILFLNRRGFSYFFHCMTCGYEMTCPHCSVALTYHKEQHKMICHYCGYRHQPIDVCPDCRSVDVGYSGFGTEMVEQEMRTLFPTVRIARLDTDSAQDKDTLSRVLEDFREGKLDILIGTQMVAKGLNFPLVDLVGIINADSSLNLPDFRSQERAFSLIVQVSGRAGRYNDHGMVVVQTFRPENPAVALASNGNYASFYEQELAVRSETRFPPFTRLVNLTIRSRNKEKSRKAAEELEALASRLVAQISSTTTDAPEVFGAAPCPLERISGNWRYHVVIRSKEASRLIWLATMIHESFCCPSGVYLEVDVDPLQML